VSVNPCGGGGGGCWEVREVKELLFHCTSLPCFLSSLIRTAK
jgi:hypothetical protein